MDTCPLEEFQILPSCASAAEEAPLLLERYVGTALRAKSTMNLSNNVVG